MQYNILNITHQIISILIIILPITTYPHAITPKHIQTIKISSASQTINTLNNTIKFQGNVTLIYQNINVYAEKILIQYTHNKNNLSTIQAYGNPVILYHTQKLNKIISAQSTTLYYDTNNNTVTLTGNAHIKQSNNSIYSDNIIYTVKNKKIKATANPGNQVITHFIIKH